MAGAKKLLDLAKGIIGGEPQKTVSAYKLFRQKGDDLYPLFVNANKPVPMGEWLEAESGPLIGGKVKSSLGPLAYRPGWHAGDLPIATHIGGKSQPGLKAPDYRPDNQVWAEVLMPDDVDWQTEALARAQRSKAGNIIPRTAHITDQIPLGGHYRYKTNPNMTGEWLIGGSMKVNRVLPDDEVRAVNEGAGVSDLPRLIELMQRRGGYAGGGSALASLAKRILSASRGSKPAAYFEIAPGATWDEGLQKSWETLGDADKKRITDRAINDYFGRWKQASGIGGELSEGVGGFGGFTNPNKIFYPDNPKNLAPALNEIGELYAQDAMMGVGRAPFAGSSPRGLVSVRLPENVEHGRVHDIYQQLLDRGLTEGHSTDVGRGTMSMLAGSGGRDTDDIARAIDSTLGGRYPVSSVAAHVAFPENRIDYGLHRQSPLVRPEASVLGSYRSPQAGATDAIKEEARSGVRSLVEEALGLTSGEKRVGREGGGRVGAAIELAKRLGRMLPEGSGYRSVPGKPAVVNMPGFGRVEARPIPEIENAAAAYNRAAGLGDHAVENFAPLHPGFSAKVAREFDRMPSNPSDPVVRRSYDALVDETLAQYRAAKDTGIDFRFLKPGQADPYAASPALGYEDIVNKGRLFVFPTDQGFGTLNKAAADSPLLRRVGRIGDKDDAVANDAFRIVHDLYGHYGPGNPFFRAPGEERAYQLHSKMFSRDALPAATAETRGQNSWVNYGPAGEINRSASGADTIYADQKIGVMPEWTSALPPAAGVDAEDYIRSLIGMRPRRAAGGSLIQDQHPTHYLPNVGRQVMADGGAASPSMNDLMATVNSVFSRSRPAATRESLTGVSSSPYISGPGAYTDAGGQQIAAPFITGMKDGYPVPPTPPAQPKEAAPSMVERILGKGRLNPLFPTGYASGGRAKFAEMATDIVAKALEKAKAVHPSNRIYAYHNLNVDKIQPQIERFNAIPAPSLAIAKPLGNPVDFGTATLIGRPHLAVPHEDNPVFRADAYTPRMPRIFEAKDWDRPYDFIFKNPGAEHNEEVPATAENIVNHMRARGILGGEGEVGMGLAKAVAHPPFKSLEEIQRSRYSLPDDAEENEELWSSLHGRASGHGGSFRQYSDYRTDWPAEQFLQGVVNYQRRGMEGLKEVYPRLPQSNELIFKGFIEDLKNTPAAYYEAKPLRPVGFDEFGGALLPTDDPRSSHVAELLSGAGVPKENILSYNPARHGERYRMLKERFGDFGFAEGGGVQDAMDIVRAARPDQREMEPSQREIDRYRDIVQQSHLTGGPASPEMRDVVVPLPFGRSIPLGRMPRATADMGELAGSALGLGARFAANLHPATRIGSYLLDAADVANTAGTLAKTGRMDASDFFSALPGNKANALGIIAALAGDEHEPARAVLNRMRDGRESGGAKIAKRVAKAAKEAEGKFIPLEEARARVASPFSDDPDAVEAARKIVESFKVPDANKKAAGSYYGVKQTRLPSEVTTTRSDIPGVTPLTPRDMTWEDFVRQAKGGTLINVSGDRSDLRRIHSINGRDLAWDADTYAGPKYMLEPNENAVWANDKGHGTGFQNAVREAAKRGPVFGVYHPMGPQSVDFAHHMFDALMAQIAHGDVSKKDMERADQIIRSGAHAKENQAAAARDLAGWPGFANAEESSDFARSLPGARRSEIIKFLDKEAQLRQGFPAVGETRVAITDPAVLMAPENMLGHRIVQFDPDNIRPEPSSFIHSTYDVPTGGRYVGDVPLVQSQYVMPEVERALMTKLASGDRIVHPFSPDQYGRGSWRKSFETRKLGQPINDEMLDSIMLGMQRQKDYGFRKGGSVVNLARDVISRKRDAA